MKAQALYDLRKLTGYCSMTDLHEFFRQAVGDPSPSGQVDVDNVPDQVCQLMTNPDLGSIMKEYGVSKRAIFQFNSAKSLGEDVTNALRLAVQADEFPERSLTRRQQIQSLPTRHADGWAAMRQERLAVANATHPTIKPDEYFDLMVIAQYYEDGDKEWFRNQAEQVVKNGWRPAGISF